MTKGLLETFNFEPTREAVAAERHGHLLIGVSAATLALLAVGGVMMSLVPWWASAALGAAVAACLVVSATDAVAVMALVVAYPLALVALVGTLTSVDARR